MKNTTIFDCKRCLADRFNFGNTVMTGWSQFQCFSFRDRCKCRLPNLLTTTLLHYSGSTVCILWTDHFLCTALESIYFKYSSTKRTTQLPNFLKLAKSFRMPGHLNHFFTHPFLENKDERIWGGKKILQKKTIEMELFYVNVYIIYHHHRFLQGSIESILV